MDFGPDQVFGIAAALAIIPIIVAHMKPALRKFWPLDGPWELLADIVGALWAVGLWQAGYAPDWISNIWAALLLGVALGVASGQVRDGTQLLQARLAQPPPQSLSMIREPMTAPRE